MKEEIKQILRKAVDSKEGSLSPAMMINAYAGGKEKEVEWLVVHGYLENVPVDKHGFNGNTYTLQFYRVTEKGYKVFEYWYKRLWFDFRGDIRTIAVSVITALLTTAGTILISGLMRP